MSFFNKKKRYGDVEGYERISRLIEDRQRELTGAVEPDAYEEDAVVLAPRREREPLDDEGVVAVSRRPAADLAAPPLAAAPPSAPSAAPPAPLAEPVAVPAAPRPMPAPDLSTVSGGASLVSKDALWEGRLVCTGDVRIEGTLQGDIETSGTLFVIEGARVSGSVRARRVLLAGEIEGQLRCDERLEVLSGGVIRAEIDTGGLVVHEGAFIDSKFQMRRDGARA